jgi:general secretion pathway protein K
MIRLSANNRRRGAALLLALWAIFVLSASVLVWAAFVQHTLAVSGQQQIETEARAMAHSGVALALHPLVTKETPALHMQAETDPGFRVKMVSEGGKLNINTLLAGEEPRRIEIFKRWLEYRGIDFNTREMMVDCLNDWLDADNLKRINGAEDEPGYHPPNRGQFMSVEEIEEVKGMEMLTQQPGWKDDVTIYGNGTIDLSAADFHILRLLPGVGDPGIERFLQWRRGADQIDGTLDDPPLQKLDQAQAFLGMNKNQWNQLGGIIGLRDNTWHITAEGWSGKVRRQVEVVAVKGSQNPMIRDWKE